MKSYQKPVVIANDDLAEGIYLASGDDSLGGIQAKDCDYFVFNQPVDVKVIGSGNVRSGAMYAAKYGISEENSYVVSITDKAQTTVTIVATAKEEGHGPVKIIDQGSAHGWTRN